MSKGGYIKYYRSLMDHKILKDPLEQYNFLKLIAVAAWQDTEQRAPNSHVVVPVKRGQLYYSDKQLMDLWGWGNTKSRNFRVLLENQKMIASKVTQKKRLITICKYEEYQADKQHDNLKPAPDDNFTATSPQLAKEGILRSLKKIEGNNACAREIANPCPDLIDSVTWEVWQQNNMVEAGLIHTLEKQGWLSEGGEA
jgi:hypothetical protein